MGKNDGFRGIFILVAALNFVAAIALFICAFIFTATIGFFYAFIAIGVVALLCGVASMVVPSIFYAKKAVPGLIFSIITVIFAAYGMVNTKNAPAVAPSVDNATGQKEAEEEKQDSGKKDEEVKEPETWVSGDNYVLIDKALFNEFQNYYANHKEEIDRKYDFKSVSFSKEYSSSFDKATTEFENDGEFFPARSAVVRTLNSKTSQLEQSKECYPFTSYTHEYLDDEISAINEIRHHYYRYGSTGYIHEKSIHSNDSFYSYMEWEYEFFDNDGIISRVVYESQVTPSNDSFDAPSEYYRIQASYKTYFVKNSYTCIE